MAKRTATAKAKKATTARRKATKKAFKNAPKIEVTDNFDRIRKTAGNLNTQVMETATEVVDGVMENGKYWTETATKKVKTTVEGISVKKGVKVVKTTAKNVNTFALESADGLVDEALVSGKKWQKVATKAINGGLELAAKQQDIVFTTLETVKGQFSKNAGRFAKLFKAN